MPMHIVQVVLDAPIDKYFDYRYQPSSGGEGMPLVGQLVTVPFGRRTAVGLVVGTGDASDVPPENLKDAGYCFQEIPPLGKAWLDLCRFAASYYHRTLGEVPASSRLSKPSFMQRVFSLCCFMVSQAVARLRSISGQLRKNSVNHLMHRSC